MNTSADQLAKAGTGVQGLQYPTPIRTFLPKLYCLPIIPPTVRPNALAFPPRPLAAPLPLARPLCPLPQAPRLPTPFSLPCRLQRSRLTPSVPFPPPFHPTRGLPSPHLPLHSTPTHLRSRRKLAARCTKRSRLASSKLRHRSPACLKLFSCEKGIKTWGVERQKCLEG